MYRLLCKWSGSFLALAGMLIAIHTSAYADESGKLKIHMDEKVIYCSAQIITTDKMFSLTMKDGLPVTTEWHIQVAQVRDYWLNEEIADITVIRSAEPDLLTRSWLLTDSSSGISRRVYDMEGALRFLSRLENFPVLDRSLLLKDTLYRASVSIRIHTSEINTTWWNNLWKPAASAMQQDFSLP